MALLLTPCSLSLLAFTRPTGTFFPLTMLLRRPLLLATRSPRLLVRKRPIHTVPQTDRVGQFSLISFFCLPFYRKPSPVSCTRSELSVRSSATFVYSPHPRTPPNLPS